MTSHDRTLSDEAIHWRVRLQSDEATDEDRRLFREWEAQSPHHRAAFEKIDGLWDQLDFPSRLVWEDIRQGSQPVSSETKRVIGGWKWAALAASIVLMTVAGLWLSDYGDGWSGKTIATAKGERLSAALEDGSIVHLNTNTAISVELSDRRRFIRLRKGEATFTVAPDHSRPFVVESAGGVTRAVGTVFNVHRQDDDVTVTVLEGTVTVSPRGPSNTSDRHTMLPAVTVGEQVRYSHNTGISPVTSADLIQVTGWQRGQLVFDLKPLGEVIEDVDRYWNGKIIVLTPNLRQHRISGVFKTGDPAAVVHALETTFHVKSMTLAGYFVFLYQ
ncbi:MAG: FecR family protein [Nitrospira sp.]